MIDCGVGEILLTSVQLDGTLMGYDKFLIEEISDKFDIPIVYNGGINSVSDIKQIFLKNINAVAVGAYFVYYGLGGLIHYPDHKQIKFLNEKVSKCNLCVMDSTAVDFIKYNDDVLFVMITKKLLRKIKVYSQEKK